jgi:ATP-dependent DNA helicase RecQ
LENLNLSLKKYFGFNEFKGQQEVIIKNLLDGNDSFVIMPTGGGKSLCYQLPALVSEGTSVVISPLIALMKNQVDLIRSNNTNSSIAHLLNSTLNKDQIKSVKNDITNGKTKLLYVAPETLSKYDTIEFLKTVNLSFLAIDEAHCISEWGHDFRPEYRKIREIIDSIDSNINIIALTATATLKVQDDILKNLRINNSKVYKSSFNRPNLFYEVRSKNNETDIDLIKYIKSNSNQSGIIYCLSRKTVEDLSNLLNINGINSLPYHAGLEKKVREENQDKFLRDDCKVIVATIAFGMGIDKPDVRFVIHYNIPKSIEGYYQETGRAGRDGVNSHCIMYYSDEDAEKLEKLLSQNRSAERNIGILLLKEVKNFAVSSISRRKFLLSYFGEKYDPNVYNDELMDDNSRNKKEKIDASEEVKFLFENFFQNNKKISFKDLVNSLPEIENKKINREYWKTLITHLIVDGVLERDINDISYLKLSKEHSNFLSQDFKYKITPNNIFDQTINISQENFKTSVIDSKLLDKLKILRKQLSEKYSLPPYAIVQEFSLEDMTYKYPIELDEFKNINGIGEGKVKKFGNYFIDLIKRYIDENNIERPEDLILRTSGEKSSKKLSLIQNIDKKIPLDEISQSRGIEFNELLSELESIVFSGTKLDIDYYVEEILDEDQQDELKEYFMDSESEDISQALEEFQGDYEEEELRLYRIKFINEVSN